MPPAPPAPPVAPELPALTDERAPSSSTAELDTEPVAPSADAATAVQDAAPLPAADDSEAERLAVLQALERGEIDVDEALTRL